jgi:lipopolysaccharide/colanic/teichoic acid biosynthesis glycosyltransferase
MASRDYKRWFWLKRLIDILASLLLIGLSLPFFLFTALLLAFAQRGQVFFTQRRPGKNEKLFQLVKFKTMRDGYDSKGQPLPDKERLTKVGHWVRKLSLDEIPQLWNVLKGEMSLVGPRPLLEEYLPLYNERQRRRHEVVPGITGWAQVNGRNALSWDEKFKHDLEYIDSWSLQLDLKILLLTVGKVLSGKGIHQPGQVTAEKFIGNNK